MTTQTFGTLYPITPTTYRDIFNLSTSSFLQPFPLAPLAKTTSQDDRVHASRTTTHTQFMNIHYHTDIPPFWHTGENE
jgi:hypothetical protein